jgi:hypothetical protein
MNAFNKKLTSQRGRTAPVGATAAGSAAAATVPRSTAATAASTATAATASAAAILEPVILAAESGAAEAATLSATALGTAAAERAPVLQGHGLQPAGQLLVGLHDQLHQILTKTETGFMNTSAKQVGMYFNKIEQF